MAREYWRTKDGRTVWIDEMTDGHLLNTIRYLERRAKHITAEINPFIVWDSEDWADFEDWGAIWLEHNVPYEALCYEARRRGLEKFLS